MQKHNKDRIQNFINDPMTSQAVYDVIKSNFSKRRSQDVQMNAASFLALNFLDEAWAELERYKSSSDEKSTGSRNPGL